jgi:hypothetical protein
MNRLVIDTLQVSDLFQSFIGSFMTAFLKVNWREVPKETRIDPGKLPTMAQRFLF